MAISFHPHTDTERDAVAELAAFPLLDALFGRRARRFGLGMTIPDGPLAYTSRHAPLSLSEVERTLLILTGVGVSGWNFGIPHTTSGAPDTGCNYPVRFVGRTYPSGAGIHASELLITDDSGSYITQVRDRDPEHLREYTEVADLDRLVEVTNRNVVRLSSDRAVLPRTPQHISGHNQWVANQPGTTLFLPIVDLTEHTLNILYILAQAGNVLYDTDHGRPLGAPEELIGKGLLHTENRLPLRDFEQSILTGAAAEASFMAYNIYLTLQAVGLGGWLYSGINTLSLLGASAAEGIPGFGFRFTRDDRWTTPNPVGLDGQFEGLVPPYVATMHAAAATFAQRKFGPGGTYDPARPGPFRDGAAVKDRVERYSPELIAYVGSVAQDIHDTYGKFPATLPSIYTGVFTQAHHLDLDFYDRFFGPDAYLETHARHLERWHGIAASTP